eukprot:6193191-Pleurochrysis_carterae.AAC.1
MSGSDIPPPLTCYLMLWVWRGCLKDWTDVRGVLPNMTTCMRRAHYLKCIRLRSSPLPFASLNPIEAGKLRKNARERDFCPVSRHCKGASGIIIMRIL